MQTFSLFVIQADYYLNKSYIKSELCINKARPKMNCNGKCYLAMKIQEQEKQDQQAPSSMKEKFEIQQFYLPQEITLVSFHGSAEVRYYYINDSFTSAYHPSVFHPPTL